MKTWRLLSMVLVLVLGMAVAAPAVTIQVRDQIGPTEKDLYQIITDWGFPLDNDALQEATPLESLPAGSYMIKHYARYSGKTQFLGTYPLSPAPPGPGDQPPADADQMFMAKKLGSQESNISFYENTDFGIFDDAHRNTLLLTTQNQNLITAPYYQSSGLIFDLGEINPFYLGQYIVAFEDGGLSDPYGDLDYNDLVVHLDPLPLPGTLPLVGGGLVCLWLLRCSRRHLALAGPLSGHNLPGKR